MCQVAGGTLARCFTCGTAYLRGTSYTAASHVDIIRYRCSCCCFAPQTVEQGVGTACLWLGQLAEQGCSLPAPDYEAAADWFGKGAALGHLECAQALGFYYENGLGESGGGVSVQHLQWLRPPIHTFLSSCAITPKMHKPMLSLLVAS